MDKSKKVCQKERERERNRGAAEGDGEEWKEGRREFKAADNYIRHES